MRARIRGAIVGVTTIIVLLLGIPLAILVQRSALDSEVVELQAVAVTTLTEIAVPPNAEQLARMALEPDAPARFAVYGVDGVKIDRAFVSGSQVSSSDRIVLRSMVKLVGALGMHVVAEGVEDLSTMHLLRELQCDLVQGFALHRPMPFADLRALVERQAHQERRAATAMAS